MESALTATLALLTLLIISAPAPCAESIAFDTGSSYYQTQPDPSYGTAYESTYGTVYDETQYTSTRESTQRMEYSNIVDAYSKVIRFYNNKLPKSQADYIASTILTHSSRYNVDPRLIVSVIVVESRFRPYAVSRSGALGLGQLMPGTAKMLGVSNPFDINQNILGTAMYIRMQFDRWKGHERVLDKVLASYNAGPAAVARHGGIPPYSETINYVKKVKQLYNYFTGS